MTMAVLLQGILQETTMLKHLAIGIPSVTKETPVLNGKTPPFAKVIDKEILRVCSKSPMLWSVSVVACTETDPGTSPRSADGASTESC